MMHSQTNIKQTWTYFITITIITITVITLLHSLPDISTDLKITKTQAFNLRHSKFRMLKNYYVTYQA